VFRYDPPGQLGGFLFGTRSGPPRGAHTPLGGLTLADPRGSRAWADAILTPGSSKCVPTRCRVHKEVHTRYPVPMRGLPLAVSLRQIISDSGLNPQPFYVPLILDRPSVGSLPAAAPKV
jgi:hypothetical protein